MRKWRGTCHVKTFSDIIRCPWRQISLYSFSWLWCVVYIVYILIFYLFSLWLSLSVCQHADWTSWVETRNGSEVRDTRHGRIQTLMNLMNTWSKSLTICSAKNLPILKQIQLILEYSVQCLQSRDGVFQSYRPWKFA